MKHPGRVIGIIVLAVFITATAIKLKGKLSPKQTRRVSTPNVLVETPLTQPVSNALQFTGDVQPLRSVGIYARVGGNLERVLVQVGDRVRTDQLLAQIDTSELHQTSVQAFATYQNNKVLFERKQELAEKSLLSSQELDNAKAAMEVSLSTYESARLRLNFASITAPFSGIITERLFDPGALINANNAVLFKLIDIEAVKVNADVQEKDVPKVKKGTAANLIVDAYPNVKFEGVLKRLSESLDLKTRTMMVEIEIPNSDGRLKPGMFGTVMIVLDTHEAALTAPTNILLKDTDGYFVWVVRDGKSWKQRVEIGWDQGNRTEILAGLTASDTLVTMGAQLLRDGNGVNISHR